jgi:hypothetical protein
MEKIWWFNKYRGKMYKAERRNYSLQQMENFEIPVRTRIIIYAYTSDKNIEAGLEPLQDMDLKILFRNFIATNYNGKVIYN